MVVGEQCRGTLHVSLVPYHSQQQVVLDVRDAMSRQTDGAEGTHHVLALHEQLAAHRAQPRQQQFLQVRQYAHRSARYLYYNNV